MGPKVDRAALALASPDDQSGSDENELKLFVLEDELKDLIDEIKETKDLSLETDPAKVKLFKARFSKLDSCYEKFISQVQKIRLHANSVGDRDKLDEMSTLRKEIREIYYQVLSDMDTAAATASSTATFPVDVRHSDVPHGLQIKLPTINLPSFSGEISNWVTFRDTFSSLVHNNADLGSVQKFHYLRSALRGSALVTISSIPIAANNYQQAWLSLMKKYDNKRIQATNLIVKILNFKPLQKNNLKSLELLCEVVLESAAAFRQLNIADPAGFILLTCGLRLLDSKTRDKFETEYGSKPDIPTFDEFSVFLQQQCINLQTDSLTISNLSNSNFSASHNSNSKNSRQVLFSTDSLENNNKCPICSNHHRVYSCPKFRASKPRQRYELAMAHHLCLNCLSATHIIKNCPSTSTCLRCKRKHHSMLHFLDSPTDETKPKSTKPTSSSPSSESTPTISALKPKCPEPNSGVSFTASGESDVSVLLATACAMIQDRLGNFNPVRILVDSGSQRSFITSACAKRLGLTLVPNPQSLRGFADRPIQGGYQQALCTLAPRKSLYPRLQTKAVVISKITEKVPLYPVPKAVRTYFERHELADETFWEPGAIDFLLGADLFGKILTGENPPAVDGFPNALGTVFGWVIMGPIELQETSSEGSLALMTSCSPNSNLDTLVRQFWNVEVIPQASKLSPEEILCEEHFVSTHSRDSDGRYIVRLPFKSNKPPKLGGSFGIALNRFRNLEYRLDKNSSLKIKYSDIIKEHTQLGYISTAIDETKYFLPYHGVLKTGSSTEVRIVYDASARTSFGSLNEHLMVGPKLHSDIRDVILNFRRYPVAITADIRHMFLQILINTADRPYQHFLFRFNSADELIRYQLNRLTFGMTCSPFIAIRVLHQLVQDEGAAFPKAAEALSNNTYVDDILAGAETPNEASILQQELISLLGKGGFTLKGWCSNITQVLNYDQAKTIDFSLFDNKSVKLLGMQWDSTSDYLSYRIQPIKLILTKRGILSAVAKMFDPLGYLAPVVFKAKILMQQLWKEELGWDVPIPLSIVQDYEQFFENLKLLASLRIPRCIFPEKLEKVCLVGFADASEQGYAAVIYLRTKFTSGNIKTFLIIAKTKLAPISHTITIPRLELCAAVLLVQLLTSIDKFTSKLNIDKVYLLSDSTVVLSWIRLSPHTLKTFVANRVSIIIENSAISNWFHVSSLDNAADIASRGLMPQSLLTSELWWNGPRWLRSPTNNWPITQQFHVESVSEIKSKSVVLVGQGVTRSYLLDTMDKYSCLNKLVRIMAYVRRFISNSRKASQTRKCGAFSLHELRKATLSLVQIVQKFYFFPTSRHQDRDFKTLAVFEDPEGILRVGGRLKHSSLIYEAKHPALLPAKAHLTILIIDYYHLNYLHAGPQLLNALLRRKYWVLSARGIIRRRVHNCVVCHRYRVKNYVTFMSDLPPSRFEQGRAFVNVGVDFAGPFKIKESNRRKASTLKCYICLFVCMSTRAVHAEVVSQLSTEAFVACLTRFVSRRGLPSKIMSDHGTNFIGAARQLKELYLWLASSQTQDTIINYLASKQVEWEFIPPSAPHFGGIWEAGVKSFKYHLNRVIKDRVLTFEEMDTIIIRIEALLNSRPLYPMSSSPEDLETLTPGHFLIGAPLTALPEHDFKNLPDNRLTRWQMLQKCITNIWSRWRRDYLNSLQQRVKWTRKNKNIELNELVLLKEQNVPPLQWPVARVVKVFPGTDGIVRVVRIRSATGEYTRPVSGLAPLLPTDVNFSVEEKLVGGDVKD